MENFNYYFPLFEILKYELFSCDIHLSKFAEEGIICIMKAGNRSEIIKKWRIEQNLINGCIIGLFDCFEVCVNDDKLPTNSMDFVSNISDPQKLTLTEENMILEVEFFTICFVNMVSRVSLYSSNLRRNFFFLFLHRKKHFSYWNDEIKP